MNMANNKPLPLGIVPEYIWHEQIIDIHAHERIADIQQAIIRFAFECVAIPKEWVAEYNSLINRVNGEGEGK